MFAFEPLGPQIFKGVTHPIELFRVQRATGVRSRLHAAHALTPFVGRERELQALVQRWELVKAGHGQVVVISGEPGIGKSRLARQFRETLSGEPHSWLKSYCSPYDANTPFAPGVNLIVSSIWSTDQSGEERLTALEQSLRDTDLKIEEAVPLIAEMLNLPRLIAISPRWRRRTSGAGG